MKIDFTRLNYLVGLLASENLLSCEERKSAVQSTRDDFPFRLQVELADSVHYHIHVEDIDQLPHGRFVAENGSVVNRAEGYIKYAFGGGVNFIFSHIPVAQKEKAIHEKGASYLDHIGIDLRSDDKPAYIVFQQIPLISSQHDYLFTRQGDGKTAVKCCHMQVKEKYWVYPDGETNYEFAFGPLVIHEGGFGIDLRPANPFLQTEEATACCGGPAKEEKRPAIFNV